MEFVKFISLSLLSVFVLKAVRFPRKISKFKHNYKSISWFSVSSGNDELISAKVVIPVALSDESLEESADNFTNYSFYFESSN
jgi:hypothetical protein